MKKKGKGDSEERRAGPEQPDPTGEIRLTFARLRRYTQLHREGADFLQALVGLLPLDTALRLGLDSRAPYIGEVRIDFPDIFYLTALAARPELARSSKRETWRALTASVEADPKHFERVVLTLSYMTQHAPEKLEAALGEVLEEAAAFARQKGEGGEDGAGRRSSKRLPKAVESSRKAEEARIRERLSQDQMSLKVANVIRRGLTKKEDAAREIGVTPRTLQRWANLSFPKGWRQAVEFYSSPSKRKET